VVAVLEVTYSAGMWPPNKRLELTIALAAAPRINAKEGHSACSPFGEHRALAAQAWCSADAAST
jgi:hypothetical protein